MYKKDAKQEFWIAFGRYMSPILSEEGNRTNWINYKTGIKHVYFKTDAGNGFAYIGLELRHPDRPTQESSFNRLLSFKNILEDVLREEWTWEPLRPDSHSNLYSRVAKEIKGVNVFETKDWPSIISFFKPRLIALDSFWGQVKYMME
jgi:hypothetical protein